MTPVSRNCYGRSAAIPLLSAAILAIGVAVAWGVFATAPEPKKSQPKTQARLVEAQPLTQATAAPVWPSGGQAVAMEQVSLVPRVSGQVISVNPAARPGAKLAKGTELARLDPADFELALKQAQAAQAQAQAALVIEQGEGALAEEEYQLAGRQLKGSDQALVLREPQLMAAKAELERTRAAVEQAKLNLQRSHILMPFDGQLLSRSIAPGMQVSTSTVLFELVNTSAFWIEVKLPRQFLPLLDTDGVATLSHPAWQGRTRDARVLDVVPAVSTTDRQARVVLQLDDPLAQQTDAPQVLLNDYLDVLLPGRKVEGAVQIPVAQVDEFSRVWVINNNQLQRRQLQLAWRGRTHVWATAGLEDGDQLLLSQIDAITEGMAVRIANSTEAAAQVSGGQH
ncbi:efflux RND transporter periplasmic adaptor subunit [Oceanobacter mangrovi]|uniref:efflux RND transporter periplasmic adaptor subunit n=1 Tax=Oceanobacter mangrovi TaxID=2862510 RepID=UPI001C8D6E58|nr:efflux RND transporter periplasmic adaptor subunit [Oceanobacter mangrovi]